MSRQRTFGVYLALTILWLIIALSRAAMMIGRTARWVDVVFLIACGALAGGYLMRTRQAHRETSALPPETPGGPPTAAK